MKKSQFPFSAVQGQAPLQMALLLAAIDPLIGGVLIEGPRGTAKSTCARGLADLLPQGEFVELPLGCTEERLIGSLNIESALQQGEIKFKPGLLAQAHQGVLYVDEVNLLADALVDVLLDVSASGVNRIERDGISHQHDASLVLVGTMNPEEGELRPQLLDRFGLFVRLPQEIEPATRKAIVRARLDYDADPELFLKQFQDSQNRLQADLAQAQSRLHQLEFSEAVYDQVSEICHQAKVEGVRADLTLLRAARAHAVWQQRDHIVQGDIVAVSEWVLGHRRNSRHDQSGSEQPESDPNNCDPNNCDSNNSDPNISDSNSTGLNKPESNSPELNHLGHHFGDADADADGAVPDHSQSDWGEMPAQVLPLATVKKVRPLPQKK